MSSDLFLDTLFQHKPAGQHILIWEKRQDDKKVSFWFDSTQAAIAHYAKQGHKQDTYVGCGTSPVALSANRRCPAAEIGGIAAAWLDVDIQDAVHSKPNLPENADKAKEIISLFPLAPTMTVHSGHGYQFWWVFDRFLTLKNAIEREQAASLMREFTWRMRDRARSLGYDLDMTFDLSRVFRIPGGFNYKDDPALPVILEQCNADLYGPHVFRDAIAKLTIALGTDATEMGQPKQASLNMATITQGESFVIDPMAEPPQDKLDTMLEFDPKFAATWTHSRKDLGDQSGSGYDLALASFAYAAEWETQEIVNLLIAFRRNHNIKPKLNTQYFEKTLRMASSAATDRAAVAELADLVETRAMVASEDAIQETAEAVSDRSAARAKCKAFLLKITKVDIARVLRYDMDPPEYRLETGKTSVHLGGITNLIEQKYFRRKLAEATGVYLPHLKPDVWKTVAQALLDIAEQASAGEDASTKGQIRHWLQNYLDHFTPLYDANEALAARRPFYHKDSLVFCSPDLRTYIATFWREVINSKVMGLMLKEYGFTPDTMNFKKSDGRWYSRSIWKIKITKDEIASSFVDMGLLANANDALIEAQRLRHQKATEFYDMAGNLPAEATIIQ